ncbi:DNA exonuclease SbcCD subunit SbcD, partial [Salmonella enterica subsp. enterica serovar Typhimurium]|nr:DNA exonuclease SbcCD subunit SbcD [Salmonella enterica subsp. enterica serovar Typhimurium]
EEVFARRLALEALDPPQRERLNQLFSSTLYALNEEHEA